MAEESDFEWPRIRRIVCEGLEPRHLLERIAHDRATRPNYPWTSVLFCVWHYPDMPQDHFDELVKEAKARLEEDPDTSRLLGRLRSAGFQLLIGTYDEPGRRDFHINVRHNPQAERAISSD